MCGRYALSRTELLKEFFEFSFTGNQILPRFNVAPTTQIPVIRLRDDGQRELIDVRWGLVPSWSRPGDQLPLLINARAETLSSKPAFRDAFQRRRCIVPASGYYEWQKLPGGAKQPFYHHASRWASHRVCWSLGERKGISLSQFSLLMILVVSGGVTPREEHAHVRAGRNAVPQTVV